MRRRGSILIAVMLVVTISALAGTTAMYFGQAAAAAAEVTLKRTRARSMAWSGVQALMSELQTQRDKLLDGEAPMVTTQWQIFENGGKRGIVRLVALEKDDSGLERWVVSENAKLDLNRATADMLGKLAPLTESLAAAIVAAREKGFASVEELVRVEGLGELLEEPAPEESGATEAAGGASQRDASLRRLLTVFGFDPNVQAGIDPGGADAKGKLRVNLNAEWSEELATAIQQRFGSDAVKSAKALFDAGEKFKTTADLVSALKKSGLPQRAWAAILDAFTVTPDPFVPGRVDINKAPAQVLAAIPGFTTESADAVVQRRQGLDTSVRRSITWPLTEGILKEDEFLKAVDWMTTRSTQWRGRVEVGVIDIQTEDGARTPRLDERMVLECVIDVASERPRVAYLRDVTLQETAAVLAESLPREPEKDDRPAPETADTGTPVGPDSSLDMDARLRMSSGLNFGNTEPAPPVSGPPTVPSSDAAGPPAPVTKPPAPKPQDRRIGRWTGRTGANTSSDESAGKGAAP